MPKQVNQVRYFGEKHSKNSDPLITKRSLMYGTAFSNHYPIIQLGVQTLPGMKIYINGHENPVIVGQTGIYELNVDGITHITKLEFDGEVLNLIDSNNTNSYLIVDYIYETEG